MHSESMECEIEENLRDQEIDHPDLPLIARAVKDYAYEIGIRMEWDIETKKLRIVGLE
jgi:hypothetical protein